MGIEAALIIGGLGTAIGAYGTISSGMAQAKAAAALRPQAENQILLASQSAADARAEAAWNSRVRRVNAQLASMDSDLAIKTAEVNTWLAQGRAEDIEDATAFDLARFGDYAAKFLGTQTAKQAASGVDINSGSALDVRGNTAASLNAEFNAILDQGITAAIDARRGGDSAAMEGISMSARIMQGAAAERIAARKAIRDGERAAMAYLYRGEADAMSISSQADALNINAVSSYVRAGSSLLSGVGNLGIAYYGRR